MTKFRKILLICVSALVLLFAAAIQFTIGWRPFLGPRKRALTNRTFAATPERLARGRYLTQGLLGCETCHSPRDWTQHGAPLLPGKELAGQQFEVPGFPGHFVAPNLTPDRETGAGTWTDDQIARAIREGIKHDDTTLFPIMPYTQYRNLSDEDLASVVVYVRSLPAVRNPLPAMQVDFPANLLARSVPLPFAGGEKLVGPWGDVTSANLTPDPSGIRYYTEATFLTALRTGYVGARALKSIMPFGEFQYLTDEDLKAIFAYLKMLKPVRHRVDNSLPPTLCRLCKQKHGAGDQN